MHLRLCNALHVLRSRGSEIGREKYIFTHEEANGQIYVMRCGIVRSTIKARTKQLKNLGRRVVYRYPVFCIFERATLCVSRSVRGRGRALVGRGGAAPHSRYSPRKFLFVCASICEFAMVMRSGRSGPTRRHPLESAYNFFPAACRDYRLRGRYAAGYKGRNFSRVKLRHARRLSAEVSFLFHSACAPGHSSSIAPINSSPSDARSVGEKRRARD